jgi:hypothetical protein
MPVYPQIDPGAISGLLDPLIKQREQAAAGEATGEAFAALQNEDYPRMARALQAIAQTQPHMAAALIGDVRAARQQKSLEAHQRALEEQFYLTPRKIGQQGLFGPEQYALPPRRAGEPWQPLAAAAAPAAAPAQATAPGAAEQTPEQKEQAYLQRYDPSGELHNMIKGVERYDIDPNTALPARQAVRAKVINGAAGLAQELGHEPYSSAEFPQRSQAYKRYANNIFPQQLTPLLRAFEHVQTANEAISALNNGNIQAANEIWNKWRAATGHGELVGAQISTKIVGSEVAKAMAGSVSGVGEREEYGTLINPNASPAAQQAALGALEQLMGEQMLVLGRAYGEATRRKDFERFLVMPRAKAFNRELEKQHAGETIDPSKMGFGRTGGGGAGQQQPQPQQPPAAQPQPRGREPTREEAVAQTIEQIAKRPNDPAWRVDRLQKLRAYLKDPNFQLPTQ